MHWRTARSSYKGPCSQGPALWLREWIEHTVPYRSFIEPYFDRLDHADMDLYIRTLVAATHLAKEKYGVPTLIPYLRVPDSYLRPTGFTNEEIIKRLQDDGALVVDVTLAREEAAGAKIHIPGDGHPTPVANRLRASILKDYIVQHLAAVLPPQPEQARSLPQAAPE